MKTIILSLFLIFYVTLSAQAQSSKEAYKAIKKVQMETEAGVNFKDYRNSVVNAKLEIDLFGGSQEGKKNPQLASSLQLALMAYESAMEIWNKKYTRTKDKFYDINIEYMLLKDEYNKYVNNFPFLSDPNLVKGSDCAKIEAEGPFSCLFRDIAIHALWKDAKNNIENAYLRMIK
jgi:hypothetical protein